MLNFFIREAALIVKVDRKLSLRCCSRCRFLTGAAASIPLQLHFHRDGIRRTHPEAAVAARCYAADATRTGTTTWSRTWIRTRGQPGPNRPAATVRFRPLRLPHRAVLQAEPPAGHPGRNRRAARDTRLQPIHGVQGVLPQADQRHGGHVPKVRPHTLTPTPRVYLQDEWSS